MLLILGHINFGEPSHNAQSLLALSVPDRRMGGTVGLNDSMTLVEAHGR